jgi:hypothetical protein
MRTLGVASGSMALTAIVGLAMALFGKSLFRESGQQYISPVTTPEGTFVGGTKITTKEESLAAGVPWWDVENQRWIYPPEVPMSTIGELGLESLVSPVTVPVPDVTTVAGLEAYKKAQEYAETISFGHYETTPENIASVKATQIGYLDQMLNAGSAASREAVLSAIYSQQLAGMSKQQILDLYPGATFREGY